MHSNRLIIILFPVLMLAAAASFYGCGGSVNKTEAGFNEIKNPKVAQIQSDLSGITITITYDTNFSHDVYVVETNSTLPDTSKYAKDRGIDKGLITFPCTGETLFKYSISSDRITAIVKTKYDMSVYDKTDFVFTKDSLYIINTSQANAGIFTGSSVYVLPSLDSKYEFQTYVSGLSSTCNLNKKLLFQVLDFCSRNDIKY